MCFGIALLINAYGFFSSENTKNKLIRSNAEIQESLKVFGKLKSLEAEIVNAEKIQREYVLSGKSSYLDKYDLTKMNIYESLSELKVLMKDEQDQLIKLGLLQLMIKTRLNLLDYIFARKSSLKSREVTRFDSAENGPVMMMSIRNFLKNMEMAENARIHSRLEEARLITAKGREVAVMANAALFIMLLGTGVLIYRINSIRNHIEEDLENAKGLAEKEVQEREQFMAQISHEVRTPMNAILGLSKILLKTPLEARQKEYLETIKNSSGVIVEILNDILDLSKVQAGKVSFEKVEFQLTSVVTSIMDLMRPRAEEKNLNLLYEMDANIPGVLVGDPIRLNQILMNLLGNSVKFTGKGAVSLSVKLKEQTADNIVLLFKVQDTGIGIPRDKLNSVFEGFNQASARISSEYGGTGLGLKIVKELVEQQGGELSVESEVNIGTQFSFYLPFGIIEEPRPQQMSSPIIAEVTLCKANVLVVEDNIVNQVITKTVLNEFGFSVDVADSGLKAIDLIKTNSYDVVLMDVQMPGYDGFDVTRMIRSLNPPLNKIPVIAMTASAGKGDEEKCIAAGMDDFISKPFDENLLFEKIRQLLPKITYQEEKTLKHEEPGKADLSYLRELSKGNRGFMVEVLGQFLVQVPVTLENMERYLHEQNWKALSDEANKLQLSLQFVGLKKTEESARLIEEFTRSGNNLNVISSLFKGIRESCELVYVQLKEEFSDLNPKIRAYENKTQN